MKWCKRCDMSKSKHVGLGHAFDPAGDGHDFGSVPKKKACATCGREFIASKPTQEACSRDCGLKLAKERYDKGLASVPKWVFGKRQAS